jgi:perosamine synthetase
MLLLSSPNISGNEWTYVKDCLDTGWVSSVGAYVTKFENTLAEFSGTKYGVATSSGTTALHISLLLAGVKRRDYIIVPNLTFIASLNSIKYTGADPILMDVDPQTWQMDLGLLETFLETETDIVKGKRVYKKNNRPISAIMPVHILGNMCDMDRLMAITTKYGLKVVEDATESLGSYYKGKHSGSFGSMGCFSFNGNKIITTGGGGVIVTDDEDLAKQAKHLTTQAKSDPFEYIHDEIGYNYRLVNVLAAMGVAQMEQLPKFVQRKKDIAQLYQEGLSDVGDITFQKITEGVDANMWLFTIMTEKQKHLLTTLNDARMQSRPFWVPMNQLKMFKKDIFITHKDTSNYIYQHCLSIPCSTDLTDEQALSVVNKIKEAF